MNFSELYDVVTRLSLSLAFFSHGMLLALKDIRELVEIT